MTFKEAAQQHGSYVDEVYGDVRHNVPQSHYVIEISEGEFKGNWMMPYDCDLCHTDWEDELDHDWVRCQEVEIHATEWQELTA